MRGGVTVKRVLHHIFSNFVPVLFFRRSLACIARYGCRASLIRALIRLPLLVRFVTSGRFCVCALADASRFLCVAGSVQRGQDIHRQPAGRKAVEVVSAPMSGLNETRTHSTRRTSATRQDFNWIKSDATGEFLFFFFKKKKNEANYLFVFCVVEAKFRA